MRLGLLLVLFLVLTGCSLNLTRREKEDVQAVCQDITLQALNARDEAIKVNQQRQFDVLNARIERLERDNNDLRTRTEELLNVVRSKWYRAH